MTASRRARSPRWTTVVLALVVALLPWTGQAAVTGSAKIDLNIADVRTSGAEEATVKIVRIFQWDVANGTGANQVNLCYQGVRTLGSAANEDLDLAGSLTNLYGTTVFTKAKLIAFSSAAANTTNVTVTRGATNGVPWITAVSSGFVLTPSSFFIFTDRSAAGVTVTAATGDLINVANASGASATYTVVICGLS
jgi:hypothetical protein